MALVHYLRLYSSFPASLISANLVLNEFLVACSGSTFSSFFGASFLGTSLTVSAGFYGDAAGDDSFFGELSEPVANLIGLFF
jgi:hypothetical protein